jgi:catabolite regulation protein CreA
MPQESKQNDPEKKIIEKFDKEGCIVFKQNTVVRFDRVRESLTNS